MTTAYDEGGVTVHLGDCREVLATLPDASIDAVVTDPPYGIGFMGREWDTFSPAMVSSRRETLQRRAKTRAEAYPEGGNTASQGGGVAITYDESTSGNQRFQAWVEEWARECLRVLKPGGHVAVFGGSRTFHRLTCGIEDAGFQISDVLTWLYGSGFPKSRNLDGDWQGWGTALKPGWEPVILARKPLIGTVAANVTEHGTGALNIDGCRIAGGESLVRPAVQRHDNVVLGQGLGAGAQVEPAGRWPANVVLDEVAAELVDKQSGASASTQRTGDRAGKGTENAGAFSGQSDILMGHNDFGGASRFFYIAKASRAERGHGNIHPTVKPLALMRWLVRLVTPPGGIILDPFGGSGTTAVAGYQEGFEVILVEREPEYVEIEIGRIRHSQKHGRQARLELDAAHA
ncbi:MAG: DNA methyltransferase [Thermomicrobiales bacterium]